LGELFAFGDEAGLEVLDVVEHDAADREHPEVLVAGAVRQVHFGRLRNKAPRDERPEAARLVLQFADHIKVLHTLHHRLAEAVNHRRGPLHSELVGCAVHVDPVGGLGLERADAVADIVDQDLGAAAGERFHARGADALEGFLAADIRGLGDVADL